MGLFRDRIYFDQGWADIDRTDRVRVGDRLVSRVIDLEFPGTEGQPKLRMTIDSSSGVPRCTDIQISSVEGGREVRTTDLQLIKIHEWMEAVFSVASDEIISVNDDGSTTSVVRAPDLTSVDARAAKDVFKKARRAGRRKADDPNLLRRVSEVYQQEALHPAVAVTLAFNVSDRTAFRYINEARKQGFLPYSKRTIKSKE
jgi:hypothetical protein